MSVLDGTELKVLDEGACAALERLGRALHLKDPDLQSTLDAVVTLAAATIEHAEFASINLMAGGRFVPQAVSGEPPNILDAVQRATGLGPCVEASNTQTVVHVTDTSTEARWDGFAAAAQGAGVSSMLCVPLWVDDLRLGSLSLYAASPGVFDDFDVLLAGLLATHAALALLGAQRNDNLRAALNSRDVIGQAKGILMERKRITADQAFAVLAQASQLRNCKLVEIATAFVQTGELA